MSFFKTLTIGLLLTPVVCLAENDKGGFSLGATRVIYDAGNKDATLTVVNTAENTPFLAQSWISNIEADSEKKDVKAANKPPFVLTPPLYRQDKGKNTLRIVKTGGDLPADRESAFWLNVKAIPAQKKKEENKSELSFAYILKVKMFYRPVGLQGEVKDAYKQLTFSRHGEKLTVKNPTPYHVTLNQVTVAGKPIKDVSAMVTPFGQQDYLIPAGSNGDRVEYRTLNDQGGVTAALTQKLN